MRTSITLIAKKAKVSKSTVSRALNRQEGVSEDAARAVLSAAKSLNYKAPSVKRGPKLRNKGGRTLTNVAVLFPTTPYAAISSTYNVYYNFLSGVGRRMFSHKMNIITAGQEQLGYFHDICLENDVRGVLVNGAESPLPVAVMELFDKIPAIWFPRVPNCVGGSHDQVTFDNSAVGRLAAGHLVSKGHTTVAYMSMKRGSRVLDERETVFCGAVSSAGCRCHVIYSSKNIGDYNRDIGEARAMVAALLRLSPRPTGVFIPADAMTVLIYQAFRDAGIEPMRDIEIVSVDNVETIVGQLDPKPVEIDTGFGLMGEIVLDQLEWRLRNPGERHRVSACVEPCVVT